MKPRTLASIGAVLLYVWCEFFQASPFAFLENRDEALVQPHIRPTLMKREDETEKGLRELFSRARRAR